MKWPRIHEAGHAEIVPIGVLPEKRPWTIRRVIRTVGVFLVWLGRQVTPTATPAGTPGRYPLATWKGDGTAYGPLPDAGFAASDIRLVWHTAEVPPTSVPGYGDGANSPHFTYTPGNGQWIQHAELSKRVGTMRGYSSTGVRCNEISVQVEISCDSDKEMGQSPGRLWVGDFTADHYRDLANFCVWLETQFPGMDLTRYHGPPDFPMFMYGTGADTRLSESGWYSARGMMTAHGSAAGQSHYDSGAMLMQSIVDAREDPITPPPPTPPKSFVYPLRHGQHGGDVQYARAMIQRAGEVLDPKLDVYDDDMADAVSVLFPNGEPNGLRLSGWQMEILLHRIYGA